MSAISPARVVIIGGIVHGYAPVSTSAPGTCLAIEVFGDAIAATVSREPMYDPKGQRVIRGGGG